MRDWRYWRNLILFGLCALATALTIAGLHRAYQAAQGYVHPARSIRPVGDTPAQQKIPYEDVVLITADGLKLAAWYTPPQNGAVILVAHGYGDRRSTRFHTLFARHRYGVLSWDLRGHGESEGQLCTMGYYEALDVEAALDFALKRPGVQRVGAWGGSMGGAATILAAARRPEIAAVVTDSTFAALEDELDIMVHVPLLRPMVRLFAELESGVSVHMVRPADHIGRISPRPVLIIQGLSDQLIPTNSGQRLYDAAGEPRMLWSEAGVEHVGMYTSLPNEYERRVISFFDSALLSSGN